MSISSDNRKNNLKKNKTFIKSHWFWFGFFIVTLLIFAVTMEVSFAEGSIQAKTITIFDQGTAKEVITYEFIYNHPILKKLSSLAYTLSFSIFISLFVLQVLQRDEDEKRKVQIFKSIFRGVFDRLVPSEVFDVIKKDILEANIVRRNVKWMFDFEVLDDKIVLCRNVMYEAHNLTSKTCNETFSYIFAATPFTKTKIEFLKWHEKGDIKTTQVLYDNEGDTELIHQNVEEHVEQIKKDILVPIDKVININFKSEEEYSSSNVFLHETHFSSACSIGWELQVNFPAGYDFDIIPVFSGSVQLVVEENTRKVYTYDGAILKGQGIDFALTKKSI